MDHMSEAVESMNVYLSGFGYSKIKYDNEMIAGYHCQGKEGAVHISIRREPLNVASIDVEVFGD